MPLRREDLPADPDQLAELVLQLAADNDHAAFNQYHAFWQ
jgi:hypothetical protein